MTEAAVIVRLCRSHKRNWSRCTLDHERNSIRYVLQLTCWTSLRISRGTISIASLINAGNMNVWFAIKLFKQEIITDSYYHSVHDVSSFTNACLLLSLHVEVSDGAVCLLHVWLHRRYGTFMARERWAHDERSGPDSLALSLWLQQQVMYMVRHQAIFRFLLFKLVVAEREWKDHHRHTTLPQSSSKASNS